MTRIRALPSGRRYRLEISGAGDPLALLHGFSGDESSWREVVEGLCDTYRLIVIDLLGHGGSDAPADVASYSMASIAADLIDLLDQLSLTRIRLVGYSMGGRLALFLGHYYPQRFRALVLESASPGLADERARADRRRRDSELADSIEARGVDWFVKYWESLPLWASQSRALIQAQRRQRLGNSARGLANSLRGMGVGVQPNLWGALASIDLPTCLIAGELDCKFRQINAAMHQAMPTSSLTIIPAAGHNTHLEQPAAFCDALRTFFQCC